MVAACSCRYGQYDTIIEQAGKTYQPVGVGTNNRMNGEIVIRLSDYPKQGDTRIHAHNTVQVDSRREIKYVQT